MKLLNRVLSAICSILIAVSAIGITVYGSDESSDIVEKFDSQMGMYTQTFASGRQFITSIPNGGSVYDAVLIDMPKNITAELRRDGYMVSMKNREPIYDKGFYVLKVRSKDIVTGENISAVFTFRIMGTPSGGSYSRKYGCPIIRCSNSYSVAEDGLLLYKFPNYKGFYSSVQNGSGDVESASFVLPVNIGYILKKNGRQISYRANERLTAPGNYTLITYAKNYGVAYGYEAVYENALQFTIPDLSIDEEAAVSSVGSSIPSPAQDPEIKTEVKENIVADSLTETYNEAANMYKEAFSNGDGFYTNIANNDISGGNVYIDIPSNMNVTMTKDGLPSQFQNKAYLNEQGTYVLNIALSHGLNTYKARFSFRIQKGIDPSNSVDSEDIDTDALMGNKADGQDFSYTENGDKSNIVNVYDKEKKMFAYTAGQEIFYANMPNGMFANGSLELDIPDSLTCSATKDGEDYEFNGEINETGEYEIYVTDIDGNTTVLSFSLYDRPINTIDEYSAPNGYLITSVTYNDYNNTYKLNAEEAKENISEEEPVEEDSEEAEVENLRSIGAEGIDFINSINEKAVSEGLLSVPFPIDGSYEIELKGENLPAISTEIKIDTTAPVVKFEGLDKNMKSTGNQVTVSCDDTEVTMTLFSKSGEETLLSENGGNAAVSGPDKYTLVAVDLAGNKSEYEFKIVRHIGAAGVGAIVLFMVIIGGIVGFIIYNSRKLTVR